MECAQSKFISESSESKPNSNSSDEKFILTWLLGFQDKLLCLVVFSLYPSLFWELKDKGNFKKNYNFDPKTSDRRQKIDISNVAYWLWF